MAAIPSRSAVVAIRRAISPRFATNSVRIGRGAVGHASSPGAHDGRRRSRNAASPSAASGDARRSASRLAIASGYRGRRAGLPQREVAGERLGRTDRRRRPGQDPARSPRRRPASSASIPSTTQWTRPDPLRLQRVDPHPRREQCPRPPLADPAHDVGRDRGRGEAQPDLREPGRRLRPRRSPRRRRTTGRHHRRGRAPGPGRRPGPGTRRSRGTAARGSSAWASFSSRVIDAAARIQATSAPAQNALPSPARTTARSAVRRLRRRTPRTPPQPVDHLRRQRIPLLRPVDRDARDRAAGP